jgi:hypothetical protein
MPAREEVIVSAVPLSLRVERGAGTGELRVDLLTCYLLTCCLAGPLDVHTARCTFCSVLIAL